MAVNKGGRPPFTPTAKDRKLVKSLASYGIPHPDIAALIINPSSNTSISDKTLRKVFRRELDTGMTEANSKVAESLYIQAIGAPAVYDENGKKVRDEQPRVPSAGIFWAKTRMGWKEPATSHEITGKSGGPLQMTNVDLEKATDEQLEALKAIVEATAVDRPDKRRDSSSVH